MKIGVRSKLFLVSLVLIAVVGLSSAVYLENALRGWLVGRIEDELSHNARATETLLVSAAEADALYPAGAPNDFDIEHIDRLADRMGEATASRVTVIADDGRVLGDSALDVAEVRAVENHANRPEVEEAMRDGMGVSQRYSTTVDRQLIYVAVPWRAGESHGIVRASLPLAEVDESVDTLRVMLALASLLGLVVAIFMSGLASHLMARTLKRLVSHARTISHGDTLRRSLVADGDDLLGGLAGSMTRLSRELSDTVDALARERDRFEAVLENMTEAVIVVDERRRITLVNQAACELLEINRDPVGRPVIEVLRAPGLQELLDKADQKQQASEEFDINPSTTKRVLAQAAPHQDSVGTVVVMHDVTDLRRLETMRRDFVANVSHELRTPVSVIRATAETLQDGAIDHPKHARRFLDALIRNSERLARLISDLLDISRVEAGEYSLEPRALSMSRAVERALDGVSTHADERGIAIETDIPDDLCVEADEQALDQVLVNLAGNAVKYGKEEGRVLIRARRLDGEAVVEVVDDGPGIPLQHRDRIFERFYRVDSGRSREVGGTGLGLSIVKHLVTSMDGAVGYKPAEQGGSIFWFTLPAANN